MLGFAEILRVHAEKYPRMTPQDYCKLAFQSEFGPEHMVTDVQQAAGGILSEWQAIPPDTPPRPPEPIGNGLCRFYLTSEYDPEEAAPLLAELFVRTAGERTGTIHGLNTRFESLRRLDVPGMDAYLDEYLLHGCPVEHHSAVFRKNYKPHYRLLKWDYARWFPVLLAVRRLMSSGRKPAVIAIDGRCGSGKTTLAEQLERLFPCNIFHMDDFYLPMAKRAPDWESIPAGNMDLSRFSQEVLEPVKRGETAEYIKFDCQTGKGADPVRAPPRPLAVVEGSYCLHPSLAGGYGLKIFLTCSKAEQERRLRGREGDYFSAFQARWIPMEERYFSVLGISDSCDMVIDTGETYF